MGLVVPITCATGLVMLAFHAAINGSEQVAFAVIVRLRLALAARALLPGVLNRAENSVQWGEAYEARVSG
jgi:hypothetical protein